MNPVWRLSVTGPLRIAKGIASGDKSVLRSFVALEHQPPNPIDKAPGGEHKIHAVITEGIRLVNRRIHAFALSAEFGRKV